MTDSTRQTGARTERRGLFGTLLREAETVGGRVLRVDLRTAFSIGVTASVFVFLSTFTVGYISDARALDLLNSILPTTRFLAISVLTSGATILALMLTLLSFGAGEGRQFDVNHFRRVRQVAQLCTALIIAATVLLLLLNTPLEKSDTFDAWYTFLYYFVVIYAALLGGALITTVVMLYKAISTLIVLTDPHQPTPEQFLVSERKNTGPGA